MRIEYTATRNIAPTHVVDTQYEIVVFAQQLDRSVRADVNRSISIDRSTVESELLGFDRTYNVTTDLIPIGAQSRIFEEFLESVINGETFTFDPDSDTAETPVNAMTVMLESTDYQPQRTLPGHYQYSFSVRVL